ncbi:MAG: sel1 repeat family protein [Succinivibrio sp.]|nr:sel1 repeat family protein [Succinivibrio sp.]
MKLPGILSKIRPRYLIIVGCLTCFVSGTYLLTRGISEYVRMTREEIIVAGLHALEHNNLHRAVGFFKIADRDDNILATDYLAWIECRRGNFEKALDYARRSILTEDHFGAYEMMGDLALLGYGSATGAGSAIYYFGEAVNAYYGGNAADVKIELRSILERALDLCQTRGDYLRIINEANRLGSPMASLYRGDVEYMGEDKSLSPRSALKSWETARKGNVVAASARQATLSFYGYGIPRDYEKAIALYQEGADNNDRVALYDMGLINLRMDKLKEGKDCLRRAANLGYGPAMSALGILAIYNDPDDDTVIRYAVNMFKNAHRLGDPTGSAFYVLMLFEGIGLMNDESEALSVLYELRGKHIDSITGLFNYLTFKINDSVYDTFDQMVELCYKQLIGEIYFDDGAPEGAIYKKEKSTAVTYFKPPFEDDTISSQVKRSIGRNYVGHLEDPTTIMMQSRPLDFPEMSMILVKYNPTSGADRFVPRLVTSINAAAPPLPKEYAIYNIDMDRINHFADVGAK